MAVRQPLPKPGDVVSVEDAVYHLLRDEIGRLVLAPNERLRLDTLAARYEVSMTPIRHALRRLESEGLVVSAPRRGAHVSPLTVEELEEIQVLRLGLEGYLAARGAERCTDRDVEAMAGRRQALEEAYQRGDFPAYVKGFWEFRDVCYRAAERPRLLRALDDQRSRFERYLLFLCRDVQAAAWLREPPDRLLDACRRRDAREAEESTRAAILGVLERLRAMLAEAGDGATGA